MDKIKDQASVVSQLVFAGETGEIYKKMLSRTWDILRETGILLWLVICLTFVGGEWFYRNSVSLGRIARTWYANLSTKSADAESPSMEATGVALLGSVKSGAVYLLSQARQQLGLPDPEPTAPVAQANSGAPPAPPAPVVDPPTLTSNSVSFTPTTSVDEDDP
jgi:hypothetical protein